MCMKMSSSRFQVIFTALTLMKTERVFFPFLQATELHVPCILWPNNLRFLFERLSQSPASFGLWLFLKEKQEFYLFMTTLSNLAAIREISKGDSHCVHLSPRTLKGFLVLNSGMNCKMPPIKDSVGQASHCASRNDAYSIGRSIA